MAVVRTPRSKWVDQGLRALAGGGPEAVRVELLAQALGVTKGGFYWHFDDRSALLDEMLDTWERTVIDEVIERVEAGGGNARAKLRRLFGLAGVYSRDGLLSIELAVRDWARRDRAVAKRLRRVDNRRTEYMRCLFEEFCSDGDDVEVRTWLSMSIFVGNHFIASDHGRRSRAEVMKLAVQRLLA
jgi:AcrR family transcriptional regulator